MAGVAPQSGFNEFNFLQQQHLLTPWTHQQVTSDTILTYTLLD